MGESVLEICGGEIFNDLVFWGVYKERNLGDKWGVWDFSKLEIFFFCLGIDKLKKLLLIKVKLSKFEVEKFILIYFLVLGFWMYLFFIFCFSSIC